MNNGASMIASSGREPFLAFISDDATLDVVQSVASQLGWRTDGCKKGGMRAAVQALSVATSPAMMLIDLTDAGAPLSEIEGLAEVCEPGTIVLAIGQVNDISLYRSLVDRGIHDYLVKPVTSAQLLEALERALKAAATPREPGTEPETTHLSMAVVGTRGGVGASTLATSIAWLLSTEMMRSTALLDLDVHFGTAALALDLEPGRALTDAIEDPLRIDGLFIERAMVRASDKLAIMATEAPLSAGLVTDGSAFVRLGQEFRQGFEASVVDLPRSMMINFPQVLTDLNAVVVVTEFTLASARDAIRILSWLKSAAPASRVVVVANKVRPGAEEISRADFSAAIERPVDFVISHDHKAALQAARLGQSFAEANRQNSVIAPLIALVQAVAGTGANTLDPGALPRKASSLLTKLDLRAVFAKKQGQPERGAARPAT